MGIFDKKEVKEAKKIYKELVQIREDSYELKIWLPKSEQEFLESKNKDSLINIYKRTLEVEKRKYIMELFGLSSFGKIYDFTSKYSKEYDSIGITLGKTFMEYLQTFVSAASITKNSKFQQAKEAERIKREQNQLLQIDNRTKDLYQQPGARRVDDMSHKQIKQMQFIIAQNEFNQKFPQYEKLNMMIMRYNLGVLSQEDSIRINNIINIGKKQISEDFDINDMLMPYLEEKSHMKILNQKENEIYISKVGYDIKAIKKIYGEIALNGRLFFETEKEQEEFYGLFEQCNMKYVRIKKQIEEERSYSEEASRMGR